MDDPFPTIYAAFLYSRLSEESFSEQASRYIAKGKLRASGRRFSTEFDRHGKPIVAVYLGRSPGPPDRVEIPRLAMADHRIEFVHGRADDCRIVQGHAAPCSCLAGWVNIRVDASEVEKLWSPTKARRNAKRPIYEREMRKELQAAAAKEPWKVLGVRDAEALLAWRRYDRGLLRDIVHEMSGRGPGRPRQGEIMCRK
jgi:hypothetical protein